MEPGTPLPKINPLTGKPFPVQLDDKKLEGEMDPLSFDVFAVRVQKWHLLESITKVKPLAFINAKHVALSYFEVRRNSILDVAGPLSTHQARKML